MYLKYLIWNLIAAENESKLTIANATVSENSIGETLPISGLPTLDKNSTESLSKKILKSKKVS
jgi:hypothetical protein